MEHENRLTGDGEEESNEEFDQRILPGLLLGDEPTWHEFYDHYKGRLDWFFEKNEVYDERDREELVQETIGAVFESLPNYDPDRASFRSWVYGVATNVMRSAQAEFSKEYEMEQTGDPALVQASLEAGDPVSGDEVRADDSHIEAVRQALKRLSGRDQEILLIRSEWLATWDEIAEELGIGTSGAKMRHKRALSRLKDALGA